MALSPSSSNDPYASIGAVVDDPYASVGADPYASIGGPSPYSPEGIAASKQALVQSEARRRQLREEADALAGVPKVFVGLRKPFSDEMLAEVQVPEELAAFGAEAIKSSPSTAAGIAAASAATPLANRVGAVLPGPLGPAARFGIPLVAGGGAAIGTRLAQEEALPQILPDSAQQLYQDTAELAARNPKSALAGQIAGAAPFFGPGNPVGVKGPAVPLITGGIGAGIEGAQQIAEGEFDPQRLALAAAGTALMNRETALGARIGPNLVTPAIREVTARMEGRPPKQQLEILNQEVGLRKETLTPNEERLATEAKQALEGQIAEQKAVEDAAKEAERAAAAQRKAAQDIQKAQAQYAANAQKAVAAAQEVPKSTQILQEAQEVPSIANVATEIGTQTSPFAVQGRINELTAAPAQPQIAPAVAPEQISPAGPRNPEIATGTGVPTEAERVMLKEQKRLVEEYQTQDRASKIARIKEINISAKKLSDKGSLTASEAERFRALMAEANALRFDVAKPLTLDKIPAPSERQSTIPSEIVLIARNDLMRNKNIYTPIVDAAVGVSHNAETAVDAVMRGQNPSVAPEQLYGAFDATRAAMREHYGDTVKLFRAVGAQREKPTTNWATTKEFAKNFGDKIIEREVPIEDIIAVNVGPNGKYHEVIVSTIKGGPTNAIQKQIPDESLLRSERPEVELPRVGEGNTVAQEAPRNQVREEPLQEPLAPTKELRLNNADIDLPPVAMMSRAAKRAELDAAGVAAYQGKPLDDINPAELSAAVGKLRRGESLDAIPKDIIETLEARKRLPKRPRGEVASAGPDLLYDAAHDAALDVAIAGIRAGRAIAEIIQMAVAKLRAMNPRATDEQIAGLERDIREAHTGPTPTPSEADMLLAEAPALGAVAGRPEEATREASRMRGTRGAVSPQLAGTLGGAPAGAVAGYALSDPQQPGESDEAYRARLLKNSLIGAAAGAASGLSIGSLARRENIARRGNRYAPVREGATQVPAPPEGQGVRQTAEKIIENRSFPKKMRETLANDPDIFYDKFGLSAAKARNKGATDDALVALMASQDPFERLSATAELANRYAVSDDPAKQAQAAELASQFAQNMTNPAQLINLGKLIESPDTYVAAVRRTLSDVGRDISPAQQAELVNLKRTALRSEKALETAEAAAKQDFSVENERAYKAAQTASAKDALAVDKYVQRLAPDSWGDILSKTIKGNLLTFKSLIQNPFGNAVFQPVNRGARGIASTLDALYSAASGKPRTLSELNPVPSKLEAQAFWDGVKVASRELLTGPSEESYAKAEIQKGFEPIRAFAQAFTGKGLAIRQDGSVAVSDRLKRLFEASPMAMNSEVMFRFLNLGDKGFRRSEEMRVLLSQARLKGLKGRELEKFIQFPDKATQALIETEGRHAIFAQDNKGVRAVNTVLDHALADALNLPKDSPVREAIKVAATTIAPYRQFPVNYVINSANYALPVMGYARAMKAASQGDRRAAFIHAGEATMGLMMYGGAAWLWKNGLISEPYSKSSKERTVQYQNMGPARLNVSGMRRAQDGGDPKWRPGDTTISWEGIGVPSFVFSIYTDRAAKGRSEAARTGEPERDQPLGEFGVLANPVAAFPGFATAALNQSFLAGVNGFLDAMQDPDEKLDRWSQNTFRAVSSIAVPNNMEAFARAKYKYIPELRGDNAIESWKNIWNFKTLQLPKDERTNLKRDIWGDPIVRTQGDKSPYIDQFLDVTKSQTRDLDAVGRALYEVYKQTDSPDVYPNIPSRTLSVNGTSVTLTPEAYDRYQQYVGAARKKYVEMVLANPRFNAPETIPEGRILALQEAYSAGAEAGKLELLKGGVQQEYFPDLTGGEATEFSRSRVVSRDVKARGRLRLQEQGK